VTAFSLAALPMMFIPSFKLLFVGTEKSLSSLVAAPANPGLEEYY
jgi:hypothetical protein